jgi:hypothetical protein
VRYLSVKNWEKYQHYKDRTPPWIKLHREVLDDYDMSCLQDASKLHLILIWVLASQLNNRIPDDPVWIGKKINATSKVNLKELIDKGFLLVEQDASNALAECSPETEAYREETEEDIPPTSAREKDAVCKMPFTEIPNEWATWAINEKGWNQEILQDVWSLFREYWQTGKGKGTKREEWTATWRQWVRKDNTKTNGAGYGKPEQKSQLQRAVEATERARLAREQRSSGAA